jgi:3-hydroxybutyryl-CoA dehydrogenase
LHYLVRFVLYVAIFEVARGRVNANLAGDVKRIVNHYGLVIGADGCRGVFGIDDFLFHDTNVHELLSTTYRDFVLRLFTKAFAQVALIRVFRAMQIVVLADALQKEELLRSQVKAGVVWINSDREFLSYPGSDAFLDLTFINTAQRQQALQQLLPTPVIVNSVVDTLNEINPSFIRINGWNTFLSSSLVEAAGNDEVKAKAGDVFSLFHKKMEWLPDEAGFVAARVVSMIINEAFLALAEGVSTKEEIDTAMKLGTAYPHGPFEWGEKIGLQNIATLLQTLSKTLPRYKPAELLLQETNKAI